MALDDQILGFVARNPSTLVLLQQAGVEPGDFVDDFGKVYHYMARMKRAHGSVPSPDVIETRFGVRLGTARRRDLPVLISELNKRKVHTAFVDALMEAADSAQDFDSVSDAIQGLQGKLNALATRNGNNHIRDLFSAEVAAEMLSEMEARRSGQRQGYPTGLTKLDNAIGGLQAQRMSVIMGRPGLGKSWLDLLFVATTVLAGGKVMLFPLEMTLFETATRLYTIFSQRCFGQERVLKNFDLTSGHVTPRKVQRFLAAMQDRFAGQLLVADVSNLSDPYTVERIEAEIEMNGPIDLAWIDYITLLKMPRNSEEDKGYQAIKALSNGCLHMCQRQHCHVGVSAQVSREAMRVREFIPRLEHIAYGDSIGQDAHHVVSINRRGEYLFYGLVKNRHGPEFGRTRVKFFVNEGHIEEDRNQDGDDE